jgi:hypothetical protein
MRLPFYALFVIAMMFLIATNFIVAQASTPSFAAAQSFATGVNPRAVATGDLNNDGRPDFATANLNSNTVSVFINTTAPGAVVSTFTDKTDFGTGTEPVAVTLFDVNSDGKLDLAVANFALNSISILLNTTAPGSLTPTFANRQNFAAGLGPLFAAVGDVNSDGKLDLAVVDVLTNTLSVLLNTTAPGAAIANFAARQEFATELGPNCVKMGDLNGDGKIDIAVSNFNTGTITILLNTTTPNATLATFGDTQELTIDGGPAFISLGDVNSDGKLDIVTANADLATVSVVLNFTAPGNSTIDFGDNQDFQTGVVPISIALADLDNDGRLDLAVANRNSNNVSVLVNTTRPNDNAASFSDKQDVATDTNPVFVQANDLNSDGKLDLAVANLGANRVSVLLNTSELGTATPSFADKQDVTTGANPRSVAVGDLNGDGRSDLAVANTNSNSVSVLINATLPGAPTTTFIARRDFATGVAPVSVAIGDFNLDGKADVAVANTNSSTLSIVINKTIPGSIEAAFVKQDFQAGDGPLFIAVGDLNLDGKPDLVIANIVATVSVFLNTTIPGADTPTFAPKIELATGDGPRSIALADINNDGKLDLAAVSFGSDSLSVLLNSTNAGAVTPAFGPIQVFPTGFRPVSVAAGDLNQDGKVDLAVANINSSTVSVLLNSTVPGAATPSFAAKKDFATGANVRSMLAEDLNGDGNLDLAIVKSTANSVAVLVNATTPGNIVAAFRERQDFAAGANSVFVTSGDLNVDGKPDLVTANFDVDSLSVLLNTPTITSAAGVVLQQGSAVTTLPIATATNYGGNGNVVVKAISNNPSNGVTISNISNSDGTVTADITAACNATTANFTLRASDGISTVTATLTVTVTANTPPTFSYQNQNVALGGSLNINPATPPSDNGGAPTITLQSLGTFTGQIRIDAAGRIEISNAAPAGTHTIVVRASDSCGASTDAAFQLTVGKADQTITFGPLADKVVGNPDFTVNAIASSGLPVTFSAAGQCSLVGNIVHITDAGSCTITASQVGDLNFNPAREVQQRFAIANASLITLSESNYNVNEDTGIVTITVNRTGDLSLPARVDYVTDDDNAGGLCGALNTGGASSRCDFGVTLGTLQFTAGEAQKTFTVPVTQDSYVEGPEKFNIKLSNLSGGADFGIRSSATVTITDGTIQLPLNGNDDTQTFVRQQYRDFLNREADPAGLAFWTAEINNCTPKPQCTSVKRVNASAAFFLSIEFQTTGNLVRNFYVVALDRPATNNMPAFEEFERDTQALQRGVIVDPINNAWEAVLANNREAFIRDFVTRPEFIQLYPTTDTPTQYVDKLFLHAGIAPSLAERDAAITEFGNATTASDAGARGHALLRIVQSPALQQREINRSFVQMQYFGYLRRNPNDAPDGNFDGFNFWLGKLNQFNGNFQAAEMVQSFLFSTEYRRRFGQ